MRKPAKILQIILGAILLLYLALTYFALYGDDRFSAVVQRMTDTVGMQWLLIIMGVILAIFALFLIIRAAVARLRLSSLDIARQDGQVTVSEDAIKAMVQAAISLFPQVVESTVHTVLTNRSGMPSLSLTADCGVCEETPITGLSDSIREKISQDLQHLTGIQADRVNVNFYTAVRR
jgi:uncharacterized alkaline shock family protein YloU